MRAPLSRVAIDMTSVLPAGANGGVKVYVMELVRMLALLAPQIQFTLLTASASHDELSALECGNVMRRLVVRSGAPAGGSRGRLAGLLSRLPLRTSSSNTTARLASQTARSIVRFAVRARSTMRRRAGRAELAAARADLLFCPFTAPIYDDGTRPVVAVVLDLQYATYPQFFSPLDATHRDLSAKDACERSTLVVTISEYVAGAVQRRFGTDPDKIRPIAIGMTRDWTVLDDASASAWLASLGVVRGRYLLYPANFWRHKNHAMLLTAFGMAVARGVPDDIRLVLTGTPDAGSAHLMANVERLGLGGRVVFAGFVDTRQLATLFGSALALVFPSLYEGYGMPVAEAMLHGLPVACSDLTSLPEVAGGAALLFDPRRPHEIADALVTLTTDEADRGRLAAASRARAATLTDSTTMARSYLEVFEDAADRWQRAAA